MTILNEVILDHPKKPGFRFKFITNHQFLTEHNGDANYLSRILKSEEDHLQDMERPLSLYINRAPRGIWCQSHYRWEAFRDREMELVYEQWQPQ
jgi:hypothetical protein